MHWAASATLGTLLGVALGVWFGIALVRHAIVRFLLWSPEEVSYDCENRTLSLKVAGTPPLPKRVYAVVTSDEPMDPPDVPPMEALSELTTETIGENLTISDNRDTPLWPNEGPWHVVIWGGTAYTKEDGISGNCVVYGVGREPSPASSRDGWGEV